VIIEPTFDPEIADVLTSQTLVVEGTATDVSVTLVIGDWVNGQFTMTGNKEDGELILTYPTTSGEIETAVFQSTTQYAFNETVSEWRAALVAENELWALMPGDGSMPPGITYASGGQLSKDTVAPPYPEVTVENLSEWGWTAAITGWFTDVGGNVPATHTHSITVQLIRFGSQEAASDALDTFSQSAVNDAHREQETALIGDQSRVLATIDPLDDLAGIRNESKVYVRMYSTIVLVRGESTEGNPTPVVVELAKRMADPVYTEKQAQNTQSVIDLSAQLDDQIADMYDTAGWFNGQVEDTRLDLDNVQAEIDNMETELENVRIEAAVQPMDCWQVGTVEFAYGTLEFAKGTFDFQRELLDTTVATLEAGLDAVEQTVNATEASAKTLDESIEASTYPPPPLYALPGDELPAIATYEQATDTARLDLESQQTDYNDLMTRADEIMSESETIVEDAQALADCSD